jgi:hypothetical protein
LVDRFNAQERRSQRRIASVIAALFELHRDRDKRPEPFTADDFLRGAGDDEDDDAPPTPEALEEFKQRMMKSFGIKD